MAQRKIFASLLLLLLSLVIAILAGETVLRIFPPKALRLVRDERNLTYQYDGTLGWFPIPGSRKTFTATRTISVVHNSLGFRDEEQKAGDGAEILFLGDSFVWGYDVESAERFTDKLRDRLPGWTVFNMGVSGYGTDQEFLLLQRYFDYYRPSIVFLVYCTHNDAYENSRNEVYKGYYKPYFVKTGKGLQLQGVPVPKSINYFLVEHDLLSKSYMGRLAAKAYFDAAAPRSLASESRDNPTTAILLAMNNYLKARNSKLVVGVTDQYSRIKEFFSGADIDCVDLTLPYRYSYPAHGGHWTPEGHTIVAERIYSYLASKKAVSVD